MSLLLRAQLATEVLRRGIATNYRDDAGGDDVYSGDYRRWYLYCGVGCIVNDTTSYITSLRCICCGYVSVAIEATKVTMRFLP